jgi:hypothetical protein
MKTATASKSKKEDTLKVTPKDRKAATAKSDDVKSFHTAKKSAYKSEK